MIDGFNSCKNVICNFIEGAMYSFPQKHFPRKFIKATKKAGKVPDLFYRLKLVEATGISTVPISGLGQKEGILKVPKQRQMIKEHLIDLAGSESSKTETND